MSFCSNCGYKLSDTARFCPNCGTRVAPVEPMVQQDPFAPPASPEPVPMPRGEPEIPAEQTVLETPAVLPEPEIVFSENDPEATIYTGGEEEKTVYVSSFRQEAETPSEPVPEEKPAAPVFIPAQEPPRAASYPYERPQEPQYAPSYTRETPAYVPPVYSNPPYDAPVKREKVPLFPKKPLGAIRRILSGLLCVLLFVCVLGGTLLGMVRMATTEAGIRAILDSVPLSDIPASTIIGDAKKGDSLTEWLQDQLYHFDPDFDDLSDRELEEYLDTQIKPFVAEKAAEFVDDVYSNKRSASISQKEVRKLIKSSAEYLDEECGLELSDSSVQELTDWILSFGLTDMADMEYIGEEFDDILTIVYWATSWYALALLGVLSLLFIFLLAKTTRSTIRTMGNVGGVFTVVGLIPGAATVLALVLPNVWENICGGMAVISLATTGALKAVYILTLAVLGAGVITLLVRWILMSIKVRKK